MANKTLLNKFQLNEAPLVACAIQKDLGLLAAVFESKVCVYDYNENLMLVTEIDVPDVKAISFCQVTFIVMAHQNGKNISMLCFELDDNPK